jgi:CheY-like chemotaxis protein
MANSGKKCILQVEDDENDVFLLDRVFKRAGIANPLHTATDGQMAIDYLAGTGQFADREKYPLPCLILLDLKLPKKDGLEVLEWIRQQPGLKRMVVVVFSSSSLEQDVDRAYDLGANSFIQKPSDAEHTVEIAQLLKGWWLGYNHFAPVYDARGSGKDQRAD